MLASKESFSPPIRVLNVYIYSPSEYTKFIFWTRPSPRLVAAGNQAPVFMGYATEPAAKGNEPKDVGFAEDGTILDKKIQYAATELAEATEVEKQARNPVIRYAKQLQEFTS